MVSTGVSKFGLKISVSKLHSMMCLELQNIIRMNIFQIKSNTHMRKPPIIIHMIDRVLNENPLENCN